MKILMVCLGNICRSPMAEGMMQKYIDQKNLNWKVDSAGTNGFHNGEHPDRRAIIESKKRGIDISNQISRQISGDDLGAHDLILVMDKQNYDTVIKLAQPDQMTKIFRIMEFATDNSVQDVPDPYYDDRFSHALNLIERGVQGVLRKYLE